MKLQVTHRQPSESGEWNSYEWSCEFDAKDWDDAYEKGRVFRRLIDGVGKGMNAEQRELLGETEIE